MAGKLVYNFNRLSLSRIKLFKKIKLKAKVFLRKLRKKDAG